jgi:PAS domain S-box-containing protein
LRLPGAAMGAFVEAFVAAAAIAVAYFLAARLGLGLLSAPSDIAVFWPASGVAAGILIIAGSRARAALVIGVFAATVAANLLGDRSLLTSSFKGLCNAGEPVLLAWLIERWFGPAFSFGDLRRVVGFVAATCLAMAASAIGGAMAMTHFHTTAPFWEAWHTWFLSGVIGILVVAPLMIGLAKAWRERPSKENVIEGLAVLGLLAVVTLFVVDCPSSSWMAYCLGPFVLPPILWLAARCEPVLAIAGTFVVSLIVICATTFGVGHFGDTALPMMERAKGAQATIVMVTVYTLTLIALLSERRAREQRLHRLLGTLPAAIYTTDKDGRITYCNPAAVELWGAAPGPGKDKWSDLCRLRYPDGRPMPAHDYPAQICLNEGRAVRGREAILERPDGTRVPVIPCPAPLFDEQGTVAGFVSMKLDITERKRAEAALADRNLQLSLAGKAALVGSFAINLDAARKDFAAQRMQISSGFAAIYGLPAETAEIPMSDWRSRVHPRDLPQMLERRHQAFAERRREDHLKYRIVRSCGAVRWIESRTFIEYDPTGHPKRLVGVNIDVTESKRAEEQQRTLSAELDHRVKNVLATVSAIITQTPKANGSLADFVAGLDNRIKSLARTHELLSDNRWHGVSLEEIVRLELAPYSAGNAAFGGPRVTLQAEPAQAVAMVLHELVTNAAKYGAFSNQDGRVLLRWRWLENGSRNRLAIEWQELGGPLVLPPTQSGYGTGIVRELIPFELGGTVDLDFAPDGLRCRLEISDDWIRGADPTSNNSEVRTQNSALALEVSA